MKNDTGVSSSSSPNTDSGCEVKHLKDIINFEGYTIPKECLSYEERLQSSKVLLHS